MAWFRKKEPEVIRRGSSDVTEERKSSGRRQKVESACNRGRATA